jgi:predicted ATP-dependent serine protease
MPCMLSIYKFVKLVPGSCRATVAGCSAISKSAIMLQGCAKVFHETGVLPVENEQSLQLRVRPTKSTPKLIDQTLFLQLQYMPIQQPHAIKRYPHRIESNSNLGFFQLHFQCVKNRRAFE